MKIESVAPTPNRASAGEGDAEDDQGRAGAEEERDHRQQGAETKREEGAGGGAPGRAQLAGVEAQLLAHQGVERDLGVLEQAAGEGLGFVFGDALGAVDQRQLLQLLVRGDGELGRLQLDLALEQLALGAHRYVFARRHGGSAGEEAGEAGEEDERWHRRRRRRSP